MKEAPMRGFAISVILAVAVSAAGATANERVAAYGPLQVYSQAVSLVHEQYLEPLSWDRLVHLGIRGLVGGLDAKSEMLTPEQYRERTAGKDRAAGDIGVELSGRQNALVVITAVEGRAAAHAGVKAGDQILQIDGTATTGMGVDEARERLRGGPGTTVVLRIRRKGWNEPRSVPVKRAQGRADTVSERDLGSHTLYVRIRAVEEATGGELEQLLTQAATKGARGMILDLRDSPGRRAEAAVKVAGMFLEPGSVIARIETRLPGRPAELRAPAEPAFPPRPLAVLVNGGTVSAAEILAGALRESGRAVIVGTTTFGDASAQSLIALSDGSALSLTTARYLTPDGRMIDGKGIRPDFTVDMPADRSAVAEATGPTGMGTDPQLALAFDIVKAASILNAPRATTVVRQNGTSHRRRLHQGMVRGGRRCHPTCRASRELMASAR
jgi:carboxyl-terminal processing protease